MAEEGDPTGRFDIGPYPSGGGGIGFEKAGERGPSLARMDVHGPAGNPADRGFRREIVVSYLNWFAGFAGQKGDERAQHAAAAPEPFARDLDNRMRLPGFTQVVEDKPWLSVPAHKARRASICSKGIPERQRPLLDGPSAGRDLDQFASRQERQLVARLGVGRMKRVPPPRAA